MTKFGGRKTAFNNGGGATKFKGRSGFGPMTRNADAAANISGDNRRVSKSNLGDGGGSGTRFSTRTAFGKGRK